MITENSKRYHPVMRSIHWIMFVLFAILFVLGAVMVEFKECCEPWKMYELHKSLGVLVFILVWVRLLTRLTTQAPPFPADFPPRTQTIVHGVAHLLYLFMIFVPISGYAVSNTNGFAVKFFGLELPTLFPKDAQLAEWAGNFHFYGAYLFLALLGLHLLGVILHQVRGQDILHRIT